MTFLIDNTWSAGDCELAAAAGAKDGWGDGWEGGFESALSSSPPVLLL